MQPVRAFLVAEKEKQSVSLEPPCQVLQIRLVPLHRVMLRRRRVDHAAGLRCGNAMLAQQLVGYIQRRFLSSQIRQSEVWLSSHSCGRSTSS